MNIHILSVLKPTLLTALLLALCSGKVPAAESGLIAHWTFDEGKGEVLHDRSGHEHHGKIMAATWVPVGDGFGLRFGDTDSYVDFGDNTALKPGGDFSFSAWVKPMADPFPNEKTNWQVFGWEDYRLSGFTCRLDGRSGSLYCRSSRGPKETAPAQGFSTAPLSKDRFQFITVVKRGDRLTLFVDGRKDADLATFPELPPNHLPFTLSAAEQSLAGVMSDVRLYAGAISPGDVVALYAEAATRHGSDTSWLGKLRLRPFIYHDTHEAIVEADFRGVLPLSPKEHIVAELRRRGGKVEQKVELTQLKESSVEDFRFDFRALAAGDYEVVVSVRSGDKARVQNVISFRHPAGPPDLPSPKDRVAGLLPVVAGPPAYGVEMSNAGGFAVRIGRHAYPVESSFTYPHGGENRLTVAGAPHAGGEREWQVRVEKFEGSAYRVVGSGRHYRITREIIPQPTRVLVKDRIENLTGADLGLALDNRIDAKGHAGVALKALAAPVPPVFVQAQDHGIGLVPLDDVYQFIQATYTEDHAGGSRIDGLGIAKGSSHTLEWAVYPIASADYYDLVNAIRRDEGLNGLTVDGCLAMSHSGVWGRCAPPEELVKFGGIKYASSGGLMKVADDPKLSFQGIEFVNYPKEREALRKTYAATKARFPGLQSGFHVAYNIYVTDQPGRLYSDSLMLAASGKHEMYANPAQYIGEPRRSDGWAFYPYYPTMSNSFGKDFLRSGDLMMDDIGVGMVWADGLLSGYAAGMGDFPTGFVRTLDPWDGFSVELDPATKTILRKWGIAAALGKDVLVEYIHRINVKGGRVWINHMTTVPRSFARQTAYWAAETNDGDARCASLHLSPAPHGLANPVRWRTTQMIYDDIRAKLQWGSLYVYYWGPGGASQLPHRMITAEMTPITIEEIRAGCIKGRERIVTLNPGVYGWPQDHHLHAIRLFDARGRTTTHAFLSTADQAGTRTQLDLAAGETAVLVRLPFIIQAGDAVNFCVTRYEDGLLELTLRGQGNVTLRLEEQTPGSLSLNGGAGEIGADRRTVHLRLEGAAQLLIEVEHRMLK